MSIDPFSAIGSAGLLIVGTENAKIKEVFNRLTNGLKEHQKPFVKIFIFVLALVGWSLHVAGMRQFLDGPIGKKKGEGATGLLFVIVFILEVLILSNKLQYDGAYFGRDFEWIFKGINGSFFSGPNGTSTEFILTIMVLASMGVITFVSTDDSNNQVSYILLSIGLIAAIMIDKYQIGDKKSIWGLFALACFFGIAATKSSEKSVKLPSPVTTASEEPKNQAPISAPEDEVKAAE